MRLTPSDIFLMHPQSLSFHTPTQWNHVSVGFLHMESTQEQTEEVICCFQEQVRDSWSWYLRVHSDALFHWVAERKEKQVGEIELCEEVDALHTLDKLDLWVSICVTDLATQQPHKTIYIYLVTAQNNFILLFPKLTIGGTKGKHRELKEIAGRWNLCRCSTPFWKSFSSLDKSYIYR